MTGYLGGRIRRIKIQNFMTYDDVDIFPKKGLNLIVGLNGSGKSSVMCAICLCLAGKPQFTGRATQLSDFIKHGHQEADIEIELESVHGNNIIIHRKLKVGDKCEWTLNGSPSNQSEIASIVREFNIDTSNLCQFLPQEKVVEFSRMDKKQRLENMLQAIGEPRLFELFNELKDFQKEVTELEQSVKKHQSNISVAEEENENISDEVQRQESRVRLKKELDILEKKKKIVIYQDNYTEYNALKMKREEAKEELNFLQKEKDEATAQEDSIFNSYQNCNKQFQKLSLYKKNVKNQMNDKKNDLIKFKEQVETAKIEYKNRLKEKEDQMKRLQDLKKEIENLKNHLAEEAQKETEFEEQETFKLQALGQLQMEINELHKKKEKISAEKNHVDYCLMDARNELSSLQNEQNKKMANLKRICKYTYQAACWLLENRNQFKSNVYLPIMLEINIQSQNNAKYVENVIPFRDMIAFVCEDKGDCERLTEIFKAQQKLPVNIVMAPDSPMSKYTSPILSEEYRNCGLECFIIDLFSAPEPIMKYLCACCNIYRIPVATSIVPSDSIEFILQNYPTFFSGNKKVSGKRSKYGHRNWSVKQDFIADKNLLVNDNLPNDNLQREVELRCHKFEEELEEKKREFEDVSAQLSEKERIQQKIRKEKKCLQEKKKNIEKLKSNYIQKTKFEKQLIPVSNEEEEKKKMSRKIISINELRENVLGELHALFEELIYAEKKIVIQIICMNIYSRNLKLARSANEDIHEKIKAAKTQFASIEKKYYEKKNFGDKLKPEICKIISLAPVAMDLDDIEQRINHIQAQLNLNEDNETLVNEFNARQRRIESLQQKIVDYQENLERLRQIIQEKKEEWLQPLQHHIGNINRKFSYYFKELNCVGEISLDIPENSDDFSKYGLQINLKFHEEETSLSELSQTHHSGGECSVAAIIFILSLQELTEVPFRCIDEINQGMDSVNERKIYQLIYNSVEDDNCSQYFLLTPKLLMDLEYPEDVAVHVIFNSPYLGLKLDVKKHLEIAQSM